MADPIDNIIAVLQRCHQNVVVHVRTLINEMEDVDMLQQILVLLQNTMNGLDANELLHLDGPVVLPNPVNEPAANPVIPVVNLVRNNIFNVLTRFTTLLVYLATRLHEMDDLNRLQQILNLLEGIINDLDANELLHPMLAGPVVQALEDMVIADDPPQAPEEMVIGNDAPQAESNSD
ncbi:uncharacterized protein LOC111829358 [Capsella rubella]|uniref:uncharacterized protein LOC111829358 n=1 Tax=Capsella rubella TaxID=81985 RepID=UPI000CD5AA93|nr:uncharacterized protein LOC111829358 [Capsella rubella]